MGDVFLYPVPSDPGAGDVRLRDPTTSGAGFPVQFAGLRAFYGGSVRELCLVAEADAAVGVGGASKIRKGASNLAIYLVPTTDPNASSLRVMTTSGVFAVRLKT